MKGYVGIDEVGRGPLAGPVTVCAVQWLDDMLPEKILTGIRDSKKLSQKKRQEWLLHAIDTMEQDSFQCAVFSVSAGEIDVCGIRGALYTASTEALLKMHTRVPIKHIYADYGLPVPKKYSHSHIIKGDEKNPLISLASIIAKESRDDAMRKLGEQFPAYGFDRHKGYGTKHHRDMIKKHGPRPIHRRSFLKKVLGTA